MLKRANTHAKARTSVRVRAAAKPATTVAKARTPAKARGAAPLRGVDQPVLQRQPALQRQAEISASVACRFATCARNRFTGSWRAALLKPPSRSPNSHFNELEIVSKRIQHIKALAVGNHDSNFRSILL
jgi:hypothetical protein